MTSANAIFVIGVSGTGKSTIAEAIAREIDAVYLDADDFHPEENVDAMSNGIPLTDEMRAGWLETVCVAASSHRSKGVTVACSALKKSYRDIIRNNVAGCRFVFLDVSREVLQERMANRPGHYMPVSLLDSQLETLERPTNGEQDVLLLDGTLPIAEITPAILDFVAN